jgi:hypothetical protein
LGFSSPRTSLPPAFTSNGTRGDPGGTVTPTSPSGSTTMVHLSDFADSFNGFILIVLARGAWSTRDVSVPGKRRQRAALIARLDTKPTRADWELWEGEIEAWLV